MQILPLIHFHSVFRTSTLHFNSFAAISASAPHVRYARSFYEPKIHPHCSVLAYRRRAVDFPTSCNLRKSVFFNLCNLCPISNHKSNIHPFWSSHSLPYLTFPTLSSGLFPFSATSLPHKNNHDLPHHPIKVQSGDKYIDYWHVLLANAFTTSFPFRVSSLNTPFQFIRSRIRISTPHCSPFIHSFRYTPQPSISFQERSVRSIHSFTASNLSTLTSGIYPPPTTCSPRNI